MPAGRWIAVTAMAGALLAASVTSAAGTVPAKGKVPKDACALLSNEQVASLVPEVESAPTDKTKVSVGCHWQSSGLSLATVNVTVTKLPGTPVAQIKLSLKTDVKDNHGTILKGVGDFAVQQSVIPPNTEIKALKHKLLVDVEFSGDHPVTSSDEAQTLVLAKAVLKKI
jgi:hypothetical protein